MTSGQIASRVLWLTIVGVAAGAGWFSGRSFAGNNGQDEQPAHGKAPARHLEPVFAFGSPPEKWIEKMKAAQDFEGLFEEWQELFPDEEEIPSQNALRWLFAKWLNEDEEGFLNFIIDLDFAHSWWAAQTLARVNPASALEMLRASAQGELEIDDYLQGSLLEALAEFQPAAYLEINPDGTLEATSSGRSGYDDWRIAVAKLAERDPQAAAEACLRWKGENASDTICAALLAVAQSWDPDDPPFADWVSLIDDPELRNFAQHARISALAESDAPAALRELYATPLRDAERTDASTIVLAHLAESDPAAALKLLRSVEAAFSSADHEYDPFSAPPAEAFANTAAQPFGHLSPGRYASGDGLEHNGARFAVLEAVTLALPEDPGEFFRALGQLRAGVPNGDRPWLQGIEGDLIRRKSESWNAAQCLACTEQWAAELNGGRDDATFSELASRAVEHNPERVLAQLDQLPTSARPSYAAQLVKHFVFSDPDQGNSLLPELTAVQWNDDLGGALGANGDDYAAFIASLPATTTLNAREAFTTQWGERDPEAAAQWLRTLPDDPAIRPAAAGLANAWASYDTHATIAWADSLPTGDGRDAVAGSLANTLAQRRGQPEAAWHWASSISNLQARAQALRDVGYYWRNGAPEEFRVQLREARQAAGLSEPEDVEEDPFQ